MSIAAHLLFELSTYQPNDASEAADLQRLIDLMRGGDVAFTRAHFVPGHVTASAFIIDRDEKKLLLHHHRRLDRWLQMGGHVDPGERPRAAAEREAREESGLTNLELAGDGIFDINIHDIPAGKGEPMHQHFDVRYLFAARSSDENRLDPEESLELRWFDLDEAAERLGSEEGRRAVRKIRALLETTVR